MGEVVNVLVAFAVIVFIVRWATSGKDTPTQQSPSTILGFRPKNVTPEMIETVHSMFPDIPTDNIRYDLLRTGSVEVTTNKLLERGFLPAPPPAYFTLFPRTPANPPPNPAAAQPAASSSNTKKTESLIERYKLHERIDSATSTGTSSVESKGKEKAGWEENAEKRGANLRERKAKMILAARQRMLAQKEKEESSSGSVPSGSTS